MTAQGQVSFALGTDTAGSGRVPACFNNLVGVKPTLGLLSAGGVVPACATLDNPTCGGLTQKDCGVSDDDLNVVDICPEMCGQCEEVDYGQRGD